MGLFDDLENKAASSMLGGSSNPLATGLLQVINNTPGGLSGWVQSFHDKGLGGVAASWVGTGQNLPISADQIQQVLGSDQVKQLAAKAGLFVATPRRFDVRRLHVIDPNDARAERFHDAEGFVYVAGPHGGGETVRSVIGDANGF